MARRLDARRRSQGLARSRTVTTKPFRGLEGNGQDKSME
jgi:hypothetical protein